MYISLLVLGLVLTAGGFVTIGFGIPINAFSLGNTLIIAGTVAVTGGLVLIGLAAAVRYLMRIADALQGGKPLPARVSRQAEAAVEAALVPPTARMPQPPPAPQPSPVPTRPAAPAPRPPDLGMPRAPDPRTSEPRASDPRAPEPRAPEPRPRAEPRFQAATPASDERGPLDWLRSRPKASAEPPVVELDDEAPLSPRTPPRPALSPLANSPLATMAEPIQEPRAWAPRPDEGHAPKADASAGPKSEVLKSEVSRPEPRFEPKFDSRPDPRFTGGRAEQVTRADSRPPAKGEAREKRLFDTMWPDRRGGRSDVRAEPRTEPAFGDASTTAPRPGRPADDKQAEARSTETKPELKTADAGPGDKKPAAHSAAESAAKPDAPKAAPSRPEPSAAPAIDAKPPVDKSPVAPSDRPVAVLKSGVIDGMAYTLYADGSIEADLPQQGTVRFASVDALRAHLEKAG